MVGAFEMTNGFPPDDVVGRPVVAAVETDTELPVVPPVVAALPVPVVPVVAVEPVVAVAVPVPVPVPVVLPPVADPAVVLPLPPVLVVTLLPPLPPVVLVMSGKFESCAVTEGRVDRLMTDRQTRSCRRLMTCFMVTLNLSEPKTLICGHPTSLFVYRRRPEGHSQVVQQRLPSVQSLSGSVDNAVSTTKADQVDQLN